MDKFYHPVPSNLHSNGEREIFSKREIKLSSGGNQSYIEDSDGDVVVSDQGTTVARVEGFSEDVTFELMSERQ